MAADKPVKRTRKPSGPSAGGLFLRQRTDPRTERRFQPGSSPAVAITMLGGSLGALAVGAGVFAQWLRAEDRGPHPYAPYLLAGGVVLFVAVLLFGRWAPRPLRVGDAGVAVEKGAGELERIAWCDVTRLLLTDAALTLQSAAGSITIPLSVHPQAAARVFAEARSRIPAHTEPFKDDALPRPDDGAGEVVPLDLPQVAGQRCKSSDKLIAFEADARLCGRCGELYHKDSVPQRCATCEAPLRG
jgi:hypothetical protein